jgi:hypothetical protein
MRLASVRCVTLVVKTPVTRLTNYSAKLQASHVPDDKPGYFLRAFLGAARVLVAGVAMLKSSSFLPDFSAAASHRGFSPRPAQVSVGFSGLRYFGATAPRAPPRPPFALNPLVANRSSLPSWAWRVRRSSRALVLRAASTCSLSFDSLSIDIDLRFIGDFMGNHCQCCAQSI